MSWNCACTSAIESKKTCPVHQGREDMKTFPANDKPITWDKLTDVLDELFPKGKCKERGQALVLLAFAKMAIDEKRIPMTTDKGEPTLHMNKQSEIKQVREALSWPNNREAINALNRLARQLEAAESEVERLRSEASYHTYKDANDQLKSMNDCLISRLEAADYLAKTISPLARSLGVLPMLHIDIEQAKQALAAYNESKGEK